MRAGSAVRYILNIINKNPKKMLSATIQDMILSMNSTHPYRLAVCGKPVFKETAL